MSLNQEIQQLVKTFRDTFPPELNTLAETGAGEISSLPIVENALKAGDKAPDFTLKNHSGEMRSLSDYLKAGAAGPDLLSRPVVPLLQLAVGHL